VRPSTLPRAPPALCSAAPAAEKSRSEQSKRTALSGVDKLIAQAQAERAQLQSKLEAFRVEADPSVEPLGGDGGGVRGSIVLDVSQLGGDIHDVVERAKYTKAELDRATELEKAFAREGAASRDRVKALERAALAEERAELAEQALAKHSQREYSLADELEQANQGVMRMRRQRDKAIADAKEAIEGQRETEAMMAKAAKSDAKLRKDLNELKATVRALTR